MTAYFPILIPIIGLVGSGLGYFVRRWLATERPFLATIKHQDEEIADLRRQLQFERLYIRSLVAALLAAGIDVPDYPDGWQ